jgi:hypothetical protein
VARPVQRDRIVLPSSKRPRHDEVIRTGDFEVVQNDADEERTLLFTGSHKSMLPPKPAQPVATPSMKAPRAPNMNLRGLVRAGHEAPAKMEKTNLRGSVRPRMDTEDRTILRPTSTLPPALLQKPVSAPPPSPRPAAGASVRPAMMPTPYMPMKPAGANVAASVAPVAIPVNAPGGGDRKSDPPGDPPSSVITAKTRIVRTRSSMSWAVGLMALGAVVGLVTAVIARGDADSLIDATATLVDPSHAAAHAGGAAAQAAILPAFLDPSSAKAAPAGTDAKGACLEIGESTVSAPVVVNGPAADKPESKKTALLQGADPSAAAKPIPPKASPVAYAAPVHHESHAAPAATHESSASASGAGGWLANITPAGAGAPISRPSKAAKGGSGGEFENAQAADALAKAQLEASLR